MKRVLNYSITKADNLKTINTYLRERYFCSKILTYFRHAEGSILLNGSPVFMNTIMSPGDTLTVIFDESEGSENIVPVDLPFKIVYEDEDILVIDKPSDMPVHPAINNFDNTLANGIAYYFENKGEEFMFRCINRLDRNTSGLLIVAKHRLSASILSDFMKKREISREYLAIASGIFNEKSGTIDLPIGRVSDSIIERFVDYENGDFAITHYNVLIDSIGYKSASVCSADDTSLFDSVDLSLYSEPCSLLKIKLDTGRTHQIRVHMSHIGHPLLGDCLYNKKPGILSRQALHSYSIKFTHPITLKEMSFKSIPFDSNGCFIC